MSLGSALKSARTAAGLSVEELAARTRIRAALIKELENDNFINCGGDTYARGHIRAIARILEIDGAQLLSEFTESFAPEERPMMDLLVENSVMKQPEEARKVSWKVLATISVSSLFIVGLAQIIISNTASVEIPEPIASSTPTESAAPSPDAVEPTPTEQATVSTGTGVQLIISAARAKSWLFVSDATGRTLFSGQISRGTTKTFSTDVSLNVKVGNAGGVDLTVNGKKVDSIGVDGEVVSVSYGVDS